MKNHENRLRKIEELIKPETGLFQTIIKEPDGSETIVRETKTKGRKVIRLIINRKIACGEKYFSF